MLKGEPQRTMIVCIDSYDDGVPKGRFYNAYHGEVQTFGSLMNLLTMIEHRLNAAGFPQAFDAIRTFGSPRLSSEDENEESEQGKGNLATFAVRVMFRQNASWQGSLSWLEGGQEESFRSVLEMIFLMDSALTPVQV